MKPFFVNAALAAFVYGLAVVPAAAQFVNNGGSTAPANTQAFGQDSPFENASTQFDGITFSLKRLIIDPAKDASVRLIGTLSADENTEAALWVIGPAPTLTDELGNVMEMVSLSGLAGCVNGPLQTNPSYCRAAEAVRLVPGVALPLSVGFAPRAGVYEPSLAELANTTVLRLRLYYTTAEGQEGEVSEISIGEIPIPKP